MSEDNWTVADWKRWSMRMTRYAYHEAKLKLRNALSDEHKDQLVRICRHQRWVHQRYGEQYRDALKHQ